MPHDKRLICSMIEVYSVLSLIPHQPVTSFAFDKKSFQELRSQGNLALSPPDQ